MGITSELRVEIKRTFVPFALERGFALDQRRAPKFLIFRRLHGEEAHIFEIQWEKYGRPRFALNFGVCPAAGTVLDGKPCPWQEAWAGGLRGRGRLYPRSGATTASWFRQDKPFFDRLFSSKKMYAPKQIVTQLMALFPEVESYWTNRTVGPHLRVYQESGSSSLS